MSDLIESPIYEPGIYQLETTDPVIGGANGVDNLQAKQLANRTAWLKDKTIRSILLTKTIDQPLTQNTFNLLSFDQITRNDDSIVNVTLPVTGITVPQGYTQARVSANVVFKSTANISTLLYSMGLMINGSQSSPFATGQSIKFMGSYLYPTEFLAMNIVTPFIPVIGGDNIGVSSYVSLLNMSILGGQSWMQIEFIK